MVISLIVVFTLSLAVQALFRKLPPQITRTTPLEIPKPTPGSPALWLGGHGVDKTGEPEQVAFIFCGEQQNDCSDHGHPELCCPPDTKCRSSSYTPSHVLCCPKPFTCNSETRAQCPVHNFQCPAALGGGCCPIGLRCASSLCLDYRYKTLAVFEPLTVLGFMTSSITEISDGPFATAAIALRNVIPTQASITGAALPTCAPHDCQPGLPGERPLDLPLSDRILGTPTAWAAKTGEVALSQADEGKDGNDAGRRLTRLACIMVGMVLITVLMMVL